jgi:predicted ArsR family transcriptional regulator
MRTKSKNASPASQRVNKSEFPKPYRDTSQAALESLDENTVSRQKHRIFAHIKSIGGATCWETEQALGILHQTASAHISRLSKAGELIDTDKRRPTGSGRMAIVWGLAQ